MNTTASIRTLSMAALIVAITAAGAIAQTGIGEDVVVRYEPDSPIAGKVISDTWKEVIVELPGSIGRTTIPQEKVRDIQYSDAPLGMSPARSLIVQGECQKALEQLQALKGDGVRSFWFEPYKAFYIAQALTCAGKHADAIAAYNHFIQTYPEARFLPDATVELGRLYASQNRFDDARKMFDKLAGGQFGTLWQYVAQYELAALLRTQGKHDQAVKQFEAFISAVEALGTALPVALTAQLNQARIAIAQSLVDDKKLQDAFKYLENLMRTSPEFSRDSQAAALAYNLLGDVTLALNQPEEARYYYLHTYVLFPSVRSAAKYALEKSYDITLKLWQTSKTETEKRMAEQFERILKRDFAN